LDLERYPCPWIVLWAGHSEADGFGFGSGFAISVQTRSIAILGCIGEFKVHCNMPQIYLAKGHEKNR
jgi:hypothetical protein